MEAFDQVLAARRPSKQQKQEWMAAFQKLVPSKDHGKVDWDTAAHMFNTGLTPEAAAKKYTSIKKTAAELAQQGRVKEAYEAVLAAKKPAEPVSPEDFVKELEGKLQLQGRVVKTKVSGMGSIDAD